VYLITFGIFSIVILSFPTPFLFVDALLFEPRSLPLEVMISSFYLALGFVMIRAARNPLEHKGVIENVILSSIMHAIIMVVFAQNTLQVVLDAGAVALMGVLSPAVGALFMSLSTVIVSVNATLLRRVNISGSRSQELKRTA
jgi:hypothetical protein